MHLFKNAKVIQNAAAQMARFASVSESIRRNSLVRAIRSDIAQTLDLIETQLHKLSPVQSLAEITSFTVKSHAADLANVTISALDQHERLAADVALALHLAELHHLSRSAQAVSTAHETYMDVRVEIRQLRSRLQRAIPPHGVAIRLSRWELQLANPPPTALLEDLSKLDEQPYAYSPRNTVDNVAKVAAERADNVTAVMKLDWTQQPEPVLRLFSDIRQRQHEEQLAECLEVGGVRAWHGVVLESVKFVKALLGL